MNAGAANNKAHNFLFMVRTSFHLCQSPESGGSSLEFES
jgi:hypothetical protein